MHFSHVEITCGFWCERRSSLLAVAYDDLNADLKSRVICSFRVIFLFPFANKSILQIATRLAARLIWGLVIMEFGFTLFLLSPSTSSSPGSPEWAKRCNVFELWTLTLYQTLKFAECRWILSSDSQYVGDPSPSTHDEPHRYNNQVVVWVWERNVCPTLTLLPLTPTSQAPLSQKRVI